MGKIPTILVRRKDDTANAGEFLINESAFDPAKYERVISAPPPAPAATVPPPAPAATDPLADLPAHWKDGDATDLKKLASVVSGRIAETKDQAIAMIDEALKTRAALAAASISAPPPAPAATGK